jgi:hypothetical protein
VGFTLLGISVRYGIRPLSASTDPTPLPPLILSPYAPLPEGPLAFEQWVQYRGEPYSFSGSGFFLKLDHDEIIAVGAAHTLVIGNPNRLAEKVAYKLNGTSEFITEVDYLYGKPGRASIDNLSLDYVLYQTSHQHVSGFALEPDLRGAAQVGERVSLFSGMGDGSGGFHELYGTVLTSNETAAWILMDEKSFNPGSMSGSPVFSQHTGQVVGMAIAARQQRTRLFPLRYDVVIGIHPIGSILSLANSANEFPGISETQH